MTTMRTDSVTGIQPALWLLISPALPVGGYSYSQGIEYAVEQGWIFDAASTADWLHGVAGATLVHTDLALLLRLHRAQCCDDTGHMDTLNDELAACRESAELLDEDRQMGRALTRLLGDLLPPTSVQKLPRQPAFATAFAAACVALDIDADAALAAYAWVWFENQVAAAIKLVPLGQTDGQRLMLEAGRQLPRYVGLARSVGDDAIGLTLPGVALASARHEHQHTRLFRS